MDLKRCAAKTATEGESSKLMEATKPMKESSAKRKAESDPVEESDDDYVDSDEENVKSGEDGYVDPESDDERPTWTVPEWDVDSFDGREYCSSENEWVDKEEIVNWRRYKHQVIESKGFYVEPGLGPGIIPVTGARLELPAGYGQTYRQYFAEMACLCLQRYNQEHSKTNGFNVEFVQVVRGNYTAGPRSKSYITFMAREKPDAPLVEYQAKVWCTFVKGENYPILCRPAPTSKKVLFFWTLLFFSHSKEAFLFVLTSLLLYLKL